MLFDGIAVVGSANISAFSRDMLIEAGFLTDQPRAVAMVSNFLEQLRKKSEPVNTRFLARIAKIEVKRRFPKGVSGSRKKISVAAPRAWLIGVN